MKRIWYIALVFCTYIAAYAACEKDEKKQESADPTSHATRSYEGQAVKTEQGPEPVEGSDKSTSTRDKPVAPYYAEASKGTQPTGFSFASSNTYKGASITPENILALAPKPSSKIMAKVQAFLRSKPEVTQWLSGTFYYEPVDREQFGTVTPFNLSFYPAEADKDPKAKEFFKQRREEMLQKSDLDIAKNSGANYVFPVTSTWMLKSSGRGNRVENINSTVGNKYGATVTKEQLQGFQQLTQGGKTYQTISRLAYWLRAQEAKKKLKLTRIELPKKYLVHIPSRPHEVEDQNFVIVQKYIPDATPLHRSPLAVDPEVIGQLVKLIGYTALWSFNEGNLLAKDNKVFVIDTEQPNVHKPLDFFHKDMTVHRKNVYHGWGQLQGEIIDRYWNEHPDEATSEAKAQLAEKMNQIKKRVTENWPKEDVQ